jgi:Cu(I)/Ag(I) efflux system periplasmic protein CusF
MKRFAILAVALLLATPGYAQMSDKKALGQVHKGTGVVTNLDRAGGKVTLKHDPIKSLNWPTMTMAFAVKDKAMLDKLSKDKKVEFEFVQQGQQFVITSIK